MQTLWDWPPQARARRRAILAATELQRRRAQRRARERIIRANSGIRWGQAAPRDPAVAARRLKAGWTVGLLVLLLSAPWLLWTACEAF